LVLLFFEQVVAHESFQSCQILLEGQGMKALVVFWYLR